MDLKPLFGTTTTIVEGLSCRITIHIYICIFCGILNFVSYNAHEHTDASDLSSDESVSGTRLYLGSESGGLFPLDSSIDTLSDIVNVDQASINKLNRLSGHNCDPQPSLW